MSRLSPPFRPQFGTGAPGANVPHNQPYFDTSTSPFTPYVYNAGAWHIYGGGSGSGNATEIQGVAVSATAPTNGQVLQYSGTDAEWEPKTIAATGASIVQTATPVCGAAVQSVVFGSAPTQGNMILVIGATTQFAPTLNSGWTGRFELTGDNGADDIFFAWKIAGASESTTQTPLASSAVGGLVAYEINNGVAGLNYAIVGSFGTTSPTVTLTNQAPNGLLVGFMYQNSNATDFPTGMTGATPDASNASGDSRTIQGFTKSPLSGLTETVSATYAHSNEEKSFAVQIH